MTQNKNNLNYLTNDYDPENYDFVDIINRKIKEIKGKSHIIITMTDLE